jgi:hypothetical protein
MMIEVPIEVLSLPEVEVKALDCCRAMRADGANFAMEAISSCDEVMRGVEFGGIEVVVEGIELDGGSWSREKESCNKSSKLKFFNCWEPKFNRPWHQRTALFGLSHLRGNNNHQNHRGI